MSGGLHDLTLTELAAGLSGKKFSSREIADGLLARIEKALRSRIAQECLPPVLKLRDLLRGQGETLLLFELEDLALFAQKLVL